MEPRATSKPRSMPRAVICPPISRAIPPIKKVNPADAPIMIMALTSDVYDRGKLYDAASTIMQQRLSQIQGVGQVSVGGSSLPAVRVDVNPTQLNSYGLGLQDVATMLNRRMPIVPKANLDQAHDHRRHHHQRPASQSGGLHAADRRLSQWRRHQVVRCGRTFRTPPKIYALPASSTASPPSSSLFSASRAPTSSTPWTASVPHFRP